MNFEDGGWRFSSGNTRYSHTENLGITFKDGQPEISYGYDGNFWHPVLDENRQNPLTAADLLELADLQIERWQQFKDWIAQRR